MLNDDRYLLILSICDIRCWYPFLASSLLNHLGPLVDLRECLRLVYGNNLTETFDYVRGNYSYVITTALKAYGCNLSGKRGALIDAIKRIKDRRLR